MTIETKENPRHVVILSASVIERDPRVRKFAQTLHDDHWQVTTLGLASPDGEKQTLPWRHLGVTPGAAPPGTGLVVKSAQRKRRGKSVWQRFGYYYWLAIGLRLWPHRYAPLFWEQEIRCEGFAQTALILDEPVDLWIANDWNMLPVALRLSAAKGGKILYDSHEYATEQFLSNRQWRLFMQPLVRAVERDCIEKTDAVSSVSPGLCAALTARYILGTPPVCIRNIPPYQAFEFRPARKVIQVLYQGVVGPGRALKALVRSTSLWRQDFCLIIRGPEGKPGYRQWLQSIIDTVNPAIEIRIEPPVPFEDMLCTAHEADIGIMALPGKSIHNRCALPNKVFEYMMAGLALCLSNHEDMADLINQYQGGVLIDGLSPEALAKAINSFDSQRVNAGKRASLLAAKQLHWENESQILTSLCDRLVAPQKEKRAKDQASK